LFVCFFGCFFLIFFSVFSVGFVQIGSKAFWIRSRGQWVFKLHPDSSVSLSTPPFWGSETIPHSSYSVSLGFKRRFSSTKKPFCHDPPKINLSPKAHSARHNLNSRLISLLVRVLACVGRRCIAAFIGVCGFAATGSSLSHSHERKTIRC